MNATKTRTVYAVTYGCDPTNVSKARQLIERDLVSMQKENVTPGELQQAKALVLRQLPLQESSEDAVAGGLLARAQLNLPLYEAGGAAERYLSLTAHDLPLPVSKWIRPNRSRPLVRGPS